MNTLENEKDNGGVYLYIRYFIRRGRLINKGNKRKTNNTRLL
nr:MAG TPA: hypothetical protein [Caudoviricetes sp.]